MSEPTPEERQAAAKTRMAELSVRFLERTRGDIATMREGLAKVVAGEADALGSVRHLAHRMVGTGATMGFESLSDRAHRIERLTDTCAPGVLADEATCTQLSLALDDLAAELQRQAGA